jgi:vacuolar-type H+-ATPase subunit H
MSYHTNLNSSSDEESSDTKILPNIRQKSSSSDEDSSDTKILPNIRQKSSSSDEDSSDTKILPNIRQKSSSSDDESLILPFTKAVISSSSDDEPKPIIRRNTLLERGKIPPPIKKKLSRSHKDSSSEEDSPIRIRLPQNNSSSSEELSSEEERKLPTKNISSTRSRTKRVLTERQDNALFYKEIEMERSKIYNKGRRKIQTILSDENNISKENTISSTPNEEKKMNPTSIPKSVLNQIFYMAGAKAMVNFLSLSSLTQRVGSGMDIDLSDIPMTLAQLAETGLPMRNINIVGLNIIVVKGDTISLNTKLTSHLIKLVLSTTLESVIRVRKSIEMEAIMPKLTTFIELGGLFLEDISFLAHSPHLTYFELCNVNRDLSLTPLLQCTQLKVLRLVNCFIRDLSIIGQLTSLHEFICTWPVSNKGTDLSFINNLTKLRLLHLKRLDLKDLDTISSCRKLETLVLEAADISNLDGLLHFPHLQSLYLSDCENCTSVAGLKHCPQLAALVLDDMPLLKDLRGVGTCSLLEEFSISNMMTPEARLEEVKACKRLKYLELRIPFVSHRTSIVMRFLESFPSLMYLVVGSVRMNLDLNLLTALPSLKRVWYTSGKVKNSELLQEKGVIVQKKMLE